MSNIAKCMAKGDCLLGATGRKRAPQTSSVPAGQDNPRDCPDTSQVAAGPVFLECLPFWRWNSRAGRGRDNNKVECIDAPSPVIGPVSPRFIFILNEFTTLL